MCIYLKDNTLLIQNAMPIWISNQTTNQVSGYMFCSIRSCRVSSQATQVSLKLPHPIWEKICFDKNTILFLCNTTLYIFFEMAILYFFQRHSIMQPNLEVWIIEWRLKSVFPQCSNLWQRNTSILGQHVNNSILCFSFVIHM